MSTTEPVTAAPPNESNPDSGPPQVEEVAGLGKREDDDEEDDEAGRVRSTAGQKRGREDDGAAASGDTKKQQKTERGEQKRPKIIFKVVEEKEPEPKQEVIEASVTPLKKLANGEVHQALLCPAHLVGRVIGRQGATILWLEAKTNTRVTIDQNFPQGEPRRINVTGPNEEAVTDAISRAAEIMQNGPPSENFHDVIAAAGKTLGGGRQHAPPVSGTGSSTGSSAGMGDRYQKALAVAQGFQGLSSSGRDTKLQGSGPEMSDIVDCPQHLVGRVVGRGGETVREIETKTGCRISIDQNFPQGVPRKITITGQASAILQAKQYIHGVMEVGPVALKNGPAAAAPPRGGGIPAAIRNAGPANKIISCDPALVGKIIGRKGETVNELQARTGCKISIDQSMPPGEPRRIQLFGNEQQCRQAEDLIRKIMANPYQSLGTLLNKNGSSSASGYSTTSTYGQQSAPGYNYTQAQQAQQYAGYGDYSQYYQQYGGNYYNAGGNYS